LEDQRGRAKATLSATPRSFEPSKRTPQARRRRAGGSWVTSLRALWAAAAADGEPVPAAYVSGLFGDVGARHDAENSREPSRVRRARLYVHADRSRRRCGSSLGSRELHARRGGEVRPRARLQGSAGCRCALEREVALLLAGAEPGLQAPGGPRCQAAR